MTDEEIYLKYRDELIRYATVLVGPSDAEDVLSVVLTRLYKSRRSLCTIDCPRPYPALLAGSGLVRRQTLRAADAVKALPSRQRAATYLTSWCGMNSTEVGDLMGCRPATVRRYVHLATRKLAGVLNNDT